MSASQHLRSPTALPRGSWSETLKRTVAEFREDKLQHWSAALTYYAVLSIFPALVAEFIKANVDGEQLLADAVAERVGPVDGMYPKLVAAAVGSAVRIAMAMSMSPLASTYPTVPA